MAPRTPRSSGTAPTAPRAVRPPNVPHGEGDSAASFLGPLLQPLLLLLIGEQPVHGYGLAERLGELGIKPRRASTLYRDLRDLEERKSIASSWDASQTRGPARRVYRLTAKGRRELDALMPMVASVSDALVEAQARHAALKAAIARQAQLKAAASEARPKRQRSG